MDSLSDMNMDIDTLRQFITNTTFMTQITESLRSTLKSQVGLRIYCDTCGARSTEVRQHRYELCEYVGADYYSEYESISEDIIKKWRDVFDGVDAPIYVQNHYNVQIYNVQLDFHCKILFPWFQQ